MVDLEGPILNYWIAKFRGMPVELLQERPVLYQPGHGQRAVPPFSSDPSMADPLIPRKGMHLQRLRAGAQLMGARRP